MRELYLEKGGLDLKKIQYYEDLKLKKGDEWKVFLAFCDSVATNKYFEPFIEAIKAEQMKNTFDNAETLDQFNFGRIMSIALDIIYKEFKDNSVKYQGLINKGGNNG